MSENNSVKASNHLDSFAQAQGYPDYATMKAFMAQRSSSLLDSHTTGTPAAQGSIPLNVGTLNYLTPSGIIKYVSDMYAKATGQAPQ